MGLCRQWRDTRNNIHRNLLRYSMVHTCIEWLNCRNQYSCRWTTGKYHFHHSFQVQSLRAWKDLEMFLCMGSVTSRPLLTTFLPCRRDRWDFIWENKEPQLSKLIPSQRDIHNLYYIFLCSHTNFIYWARHNSGWSFSLWLFLVFCLHYLLHTLNCVSNL